MARVIKDPTEQKLDDNERAIANTYAALSAANEHWIVVYRGALAFRFGPYTGPEAGAILERCMKQRIAANLVSNCGREFDWEIARDLGMRLVLPEDRPTPKGLLLRAWQRLRGRGR